MKKHGLEICRSCLQMFPDHTSLEKHKAETGHGTRGRKAAPIGSFYCEKCKQYFIDSVEYTTHMKIHPESEQPSGTNGDGDLTTNRTNMPESSTSHASQNANSETVMTNTRLPSEHNPALIECTRDAAGNSFLDRIDPGHTDNPFEDLESNNNLNSQAMQDNSDTSAAHTTSISSESLTSGELENRPLTQNNKFFINDELFQDNYWGINQSSSQGTKQRINSFSANDLADAESFINEKVNDMATPARIESKSGSKKRKSKMNRQEDVGQKQKFKRESPSEQDDYIGLKRESPVEEKFSSPEDFFLEENSECQIKEEPSLNQEHQGSHNLDREINTESLSGSINISEISLEPEQNDFPYKVLDGYKHCCRVCNISFKKTSHLRRHMKTHQNECQYKCLYCGNTCASQDELSAHIKLHAEKGREPNRAMCMYCGRTFRTKSEMDRHMFSHTGEKPFSCPQCPQKFTRKHSLKQHKLTVHAGQRQTCTMCPKSFTSKSNLKIHLTLHSRNLIDDHGNMRTITSGLEEGGKVDEKNTEKPYKALCTLCGKAFQNKTGL